MRFLSAAGAIYLGIYLILPGCLCQLLGAIGIEVSEGSSPVHSEEFSSWENVVTCHCNEHESKNAEAMASVDFERIEQSPTGEFADFSLPTLRDSEAQRLPTSRGPPLSALSWSSRAFSGVFLI